MLPSLSCTAGLDPQQVALLPAEPEQAARAPPDVGCGGHGHPGRRPDGWSSGWVAAAGAPQTAATSYFGASLTGWVEPMSTWALMALASGFFCTDDGRERRMRGKRRRCERRRDRRPRLEVEAAAGPAAAPRGGSGGGTGGGGSGGGSVSQESHRHLTVGTKLVPAESMPPWT
jgi:hypothetical protein